MKSFKISDDSGFLAIVNADRYKSFVREDWDFYELMVHFVAEMNNDSLVIWATGLENSWSVAFLPGPSTRHAFREFTKTIEVTAGRLHLTNYEDLTLSAQFSDQNLPPSTATPNTSSSRMAATPLPSARRIIPTTSTPTSQISRSSQSRRQSTPAQQQKISIGGKAK